MTYRTNKKSCEYATPNKQGQIAKDCLLFTYMKMHCWDINKGNYDEVAKNCKVLKGEFCENYKKGV